MKTCRGRYVTRVCLGVMGISLAAIAQGPPYLSSELLRDRLWVWGNPEMAQPGPHTVDTFAAASPVERAALLGTPNIILAGNGLPRTLEQADTWTAEVANAPRLVWEIAVDDEKGGPPFTFDQTVARLAEVVMKYPQVEGVLLDDMSTMMVDRGFKPEHIRALREQLNQKCPELKIWGVVYSMNLDKPELAAYIQELDVVNLWVWHASDTAEIERYVAQVQQAFPSKPIVLGLYLYDYGAGQSMSRSILERQCAAALELLKTQRIEGLVFLTINDDPETVSYAANWTRTHADTPVRTPEATVNLSMKTSDGWLFSHEGWGENEEGAIHPPDVRNLHSRAFQTENVFGDFTAEFEFNGNYRETGTGAAGMFLRAQDANHFYYVYFPWGGQQLRAKHFWAAIAKVEGDGYLRNLAADWIPGLPSETDRWYQVRVQARGPEIRVWVDGREALTVRDDAYAQGAAGFAGYGWYAFRNARITGAPSPAMSWEKTVTIPSHAFTIGLSSAEMPSSCIAPNGDVLVAAGNQLVRSSDKGRTWQAPETLPESLGTITDYGNGMFHTSQGRLMVMLYANDPKQPGIAPKIAMAESTDNGHTWTEPVPSVIAPEWPAFPTSLVPYGPVTEAKDGALLRFLLGGAKEEGTLFTDVRTFGATRAKAYVIRSNDAGLNWTAPIELDRPRWTDMERGGAPGSLDFTEPTAVVIGDTVTALIRPIYSPYMWQCWSYDGGVTWDAASRATFPGYAQSMVRTASGAILCAHRFPQYSVNVSRDDGLNWDAGTVIDYPVWGMGTALEVEPDVVLFTYMNAERAMPLLAQLVRVTPTRVEPVSAGQG